MFYIVGISQLLHIVSLVDVKGHEKGESEHQVVAGFSSVKTLFPGSEGKCYRIHYKRGQPKRQIGPFMLHWFLRMSKALILLYLCESRPKNIRRTIIRIPKFSL